MSMAATRVLRTAEMMLRTSDRMRAKRENGKKQGKRLSSVSVALEDGQAVMEIRSFRDVHDGMDDEERDECLGYQVIQVG